MKEGGAGGGGGVSVDGRNLMRTLIKRNKNAVDCVSEKQLSLIKKIMK